jgi:hypothetical protein
MKNPIKIIHKFKNNNRRIQYNNYIYIGSLVDNEILDILNKIKDFDLYTTFIKLSMKDYKIISDFYGDKWYEFFFNSHHIDFQKKEIINTTSKKKELENKYGNDWYNEHINKERRDKQIYSFASLFFNEQLLKNKIQTISKNVNEIDFRTNEEQKGGNDNDIDNDDDDDEDNEITNEVLEDKIDEEINLDELSKLYTIADKETSKEIQETTKLISEAIKNTKWDKSISDNNKLYDDRYDNLPYDIKLEDVYNKIYITEQYIFKDDTIKNIKNKISISLPLSKKFKDIKILPECQYLWSEYKINNKYDHVMIGQKWIKKNELLKIDIIPNDNLNIYKNLRNNLRYLKDSFEYKIKREDDEFNILDYYDNFITNNEIYLLDLYNELGINYSSSEEEKKNLFDVFIHIYFPMISYERYEQLIKFLNGDTEKEIEYVENIYKTLNNDIKLETEIENLVEKYKLKPELYNKYFENNYIMQSIIHLNLNDSKNITGTNSNKINLYRIFDNFEVNQEFPFIQFLTLDTELIYKYYNPDNIDEEYKKLIQKWFENSVYGLSFKIKINENKFDKYISIDLTDNGRIEYKITWKEDDKTLMEDIEKTYKYVKLLIKKINSENKKVKLIIPDDDRFKFAFINTIQKFKIPDKYNINHNDLSDFSRYFFPYVSLVIEPKKRTAELSKSSIFSKYGTYLRYKRINKYESRNRIHMKILYLIKNFEFTDKELLEEVSKQFNITIENSAKEIDYVRDKFKKSLNKMKKLKKIKISSKNKLPGIGIDIQGREKENYKIRISGARNREQLVEIEKFIKVLIYIYIETFILKNSKFEKIKQMLKSLNKIAKRKNKVIELVDQDYDINNNIKNITSLDKERLGFKPEKGQNQWSRSCQNSGDDVKRRPFIVPDKQIDQLIKKGYKLNKETNLYEKKITVNNKTIVIKAIKLSNPDNTFNYYTCDPDENKDNIHIGFLTKGNNPNNLCMPCCFKKDQYLTINKNKKNYFNKCIDDNIKIYENEKSELGDKIYILKDNNKNNENKVVLLPKYLDIILNILSNNDKIIKNHYLSESNSGYYFKYTVKNDKYPFLEAISNIFNISISDIKNKIIDFIKKNKKYYYYLNNGDISESFKSIDLFINYLNKSDYFEYELIGELLALPGLLTENGLIYFIFNKKEIIVKKRLEKDKIKYVYNLECLNIENEYQLSESNRDVIILLKENKNYYPIIKIYKNSQHTIIENNWKINKIDKLINEFKKYYNNSCNNILINNDLYNKNLIFRLKDLKINKQLIDHNNKTRYILLNNNLLIPTIPSGISYDYAIENIKNFTSYENYKKVIELLKDIENKIHLKYIPKSILYNDIKNNKINIVSILLENNLQIPIKQEYINELDIKKLNLFVIYQNLNDNIDNAIINYNNQPIYDNRVKNVNLRNFLTESYNLFRLELSLFLYDNVDIKNNIIDIVRNNNIIDKIDKLKEILNKYINEKLIKKINNLPDLKNYKLSNFREYCKIHNTKDKCNNNLHCVWDKDNCKLSLTNDMIINSINKIISEMIQDGIKFKELIQENNYYVSDVINNLDFTFRPNQQIIKTNNFNLNKLIEELFGKDKNLKFGKNNKKNDNDIIVEDYPELKELGNMYIQQLISNKDTVIRSYVNSFYWIKNNLYDIESRNLGYYNNFQTLLTNIFKAYIIDFIQININKEDSIHKDFINNYFVKEDNFFDSKLNKYRKSTFNTDGIKELYILSYLFPYPIIVYDNYSNIKHIFLQGEIPINNDTIKNFTQPDKLKNSICIKFEYDSSKIIPKNIYSIYYK